MGTVLQWHGLVFFWLNGPFTLIVWFLGQFSLYIAFRVEVGFGRCLELAGSKLLLLTDFLYKEGGRTYFFLSCLMGEGKDF